MANLVSVVSSIEVREDADISLTSHLTVRLDLLLGDFRVYCSIILNGTCNKRHMLITAAKLPSRGHKSALVSYRQLQISRNAAGGLGLWVPVDGSADHYESVHPNSRMC